MFITPRSQFDFKPVGGGMVQLQGDLEYIDDKCGLITVPDGFVYDLASYGRVSRGIFDRLAQSMRPATVHDYLYEHQPPGVSRGDADRIYRDALALEGAGWLSRWVQWSGVRAGGWLWWD